MMKQSPVEFAREVRREVAKVSWPSRKETIWTTTMVFLMVFLAAIFFLVVDQIISALVRLTFGVGG